MNALRESRSADGAMLYAAREASLVEVQEQPNVVYSCRCHVVWCPQ